MALSRLLLRRLNLSRHNSVYMLPQITVASEFSSLSAASDATPQTISSPKPSSLSARMSFIFDQIDEIEKKREEKDQTLQRIRAWRESKKQLHNISLEPAPNATEGDTLENLKSEMVKSEAFLVGGDAAKEVEFVHPWPEWIELMERLVQQNYFDHRRKDEDSMMEGLGIHVPETAKKEDKRIDFARDFKTVQAAMVNFGRDRFDILRSLSRHDLQLLVGYGCPSADKRVVFSAKLLRKLVHLDEGDVCSSCSLRSSCEKAYLLTNKEDEAWTIDVMRILLTYGFDPIDRSVANKSLLKIKSVKAVVRKLLHEVVKLSAVPIDPNIPPPIIKKPPPKVKQPPPTPKKRVGRYDVEMKKGDWLCPKCDFLNFAKNTVCMQCDAKRPKRQLLPGEWECPQCNFLNYRRNTACFHCEHKRPHDTYTESELPDKPQISSIRKNKVCDRAAVSGAWNFDFDDDESDGADVANFEYADSQKLDEDFPLNKPSRGNSREHDHDFGRGRREYSDSGPLRPGLGFNDFDEEEEDDDDDDDDVDNYELVAPNEVSKISKIGFSDLEADSESEDIEMNDSKLAARRKRNFPPRAQKKMHQQGFIDSEAAEIDFDTDDDLPVHPDWKSSHVANRKQQDKYQDGRVFGSGDDLGFSSDTDDDNLRSKMKENGKGLNGVRNTRGGGQRFKTESFSGDDFEDDIRYHSDKNRKTGLYHPVKGSRGGTRFKAESFSSDDSDGDLRYHSDKRKKAGFDRPVRASRGGGNKFKSKSFSEDDSEDDSRFHRDKQRNKAGFDRPVRASKGGGTKFKSKSFSADDSEDDSRFHRDKQIKKAGFDPSGRASRGRIGMTTNKKSSLGRGSDQSSVPRPNSLGTQNFRDDRSWSSKDNKSSKFNSPRRGGSFEKRGGRSNNFDSDMDDERNLRPRMNVR